jgi:hypothetical protein
MPDEVLSAMEMVGVRPLNIQLLAPEREGEETAIEVSADDGHVLVHAVTDMEVGQWAEAACHRAERRLTPTGWLWDYPHPDHLIRCANCLALFPLSKNP